MNSSHSGWSGGVEEAAKKQKVEGRRCCCCCQTSTTTLSLRYFLSPSLASYTVQHSRSSPHTTPPVSNSHPPYLAPTRLWSSSRQLSLHAATFPSCFLLTCMTSSHSDNPHCPPRAALLCCSDSSRSLSILCFCPPRVAPVSRSAQRVPAAQTERYSTRHALTARAGSRTPSQAAH